MAGCCVLALASSPVVRADPVTPDRALFAVRVIEATKSATPRLDPALGDIDRELQIFRRDYNQFIIVGRQDLSLAINARGVVKLRDGSEFSLILLGFSHGPVQRARHQVEMPRMKMTRAMALGGRTLDILPATDRLTIVSTTYVR